MTDARPDPVQRFFGAALMAIGGLIAALCGLCTLLVIGVTLIGMFSNPSNLGLMLTGVFSGALVVAIVGGLPIVVGILIFRWGRRLFRPPPRIPDDQIAVFGDEPAEGGPDG